MTPTNASTHPDHPPPEACQISPPSREADTSPPNALLTIAGSRAEANHHVYIVRASLPGGATESAHRYSALRTLHHTLAALGPLPPFPAPKRLFKRAAWVVREREVLLQRFLDDCVSAAARSPTTRDAVAICFGPDAPPARDALAAFLGLPKATAVEPAAAPEVAPTAAPAPAPSPATERSLPAEARSDAERRRAAEAYASAASLWAALRDGQAILLRATWLLPRAGPEDGEVHAAHEGRASDSDLCRACSRRTCAPSEGGGSARGASVYDGSVGPISPPTASTTIHISCCVLSPQPKSPPLGGPLKRKATSAEASTLQPKRIE